MKWKRSAAALLILMCLAAFPWGPLFAWSPVHPGYREFRSARADVLYPDSVVLDPAYRDVEQYLTTAQNFHELRFRKKIKVIVCRNWNDCLRLGAPLFIGQRPLAVTDVTGTITFITPKGNGWTDIGALLRHEFSHAVLSQNSSLLRVWRMLKEPWVSEGIAGVVSAQGTTAPESHLVSLPEKEFLSRAAAEDLWPSFAGPWQKDWTFSYTASMYFWDRQIARRGKASFLRFESMCFTDPRTCRSAYAEVYGSNLRSAVNEFQSEVRAGQVVAPERSDRDGVLYPLRMHYAPF
jgi:hypothetical protein